MPDTPTSPPPDFRPKRVGANTVAPPPPDVMLLNLGQVAYLLQVSVTTVRRMIDENVIRSVGIKSRALVSRAAVEDFIRSADLAKAPTSEVAARISAEEKRAREQRLKTRVKADWNTGEDQINLEAYLARQAERRAKKKARSPG